MDNLSSVYKLLLMDCRVCVLCIELWVRYGNLLRVEIPRKRDILMNLFLVWCNVCRPYSAYFLWKRILYFLLSLEGLVCISGTPLLSITAIFICMCLIVFFFYHAAHGIHYFRPFFNYIFHQLLQKFIKSLIFIYKTG